MPESEIVIIIVVGTLLMLTLGASILFFVVTYKKRQARYKLEKTNMQYEFHEQLLRTQLEIQEQTLKNISQEIHDNIGQTLSLVKLNLNTIVMDVINPPFKLSYTIDLLSNAIQGLRDLSKALHKDAVLSNGLIAAVEFEILNIERSGVFKTHMNVPNDVLVIDSNKELILFRIIQESLNNIIKHSSAKLISIDIKVHAYKVIVLIEDDGTGFNSNNQHEGLGLRNMKSRAILIGGKLDLHTNAHGTKVLIEIPI